MKHFSRNNLLIGSGVVVIVIAIVLARVFMHQPAAPLPPSLSLSSSSSPNPAATSSQQRAIDTSLSLAPTALPQSSAVTPPSEPVVVYNGCNLSLGFGVTSGNLQSAGTTQYALAAKNLGNATCQSASISLYYADNESFVSSSPNAKDGYYWPLGDLAPGQEIDIALTTTRTNTPATDVTTNEACLSANNGSDACANAGSASSLPAASTQTASILPPSTSATVASLPQPGKEYGVWSWTGLSEMSTAQMQQVINEAAANHFNVIYQTVDEELTTSNMSAYLNAVGTFLSLAQQKGIRVDAEAGARDWGQPANRSKATNILTFVANYNQSHAIKFGGMQYDIEPYLLPQYANNESGVLTNYVQLIDTLVTQDQKEDVALTVDVPHFYDDQVQWTPPITVDGVTNYTYNQLLRLLSKLSGSRIIVMAYRNFAAGADGSVDLAQTEVQEADATNVKVIVAQETGPVTPSYVTFNGMTRTDLFTQIGVIDQSFANDTSFDGIGIDYLTPFLNLP